MASTERRAAPTPAAPSRAPSQARSPWEQCDRCQSPVDERQRYCVVCGTHQRRSDDPAARFFAAARRPKQAAIRPVVAPDRRLSTTTAAVLIALLPLAAGVGIVVGRGSADSGDQVIQALKAVQPSGTAVGAVVSSTPTTTAAAAAGAAGAEGQTESGKKGGKVEGVETTDKQAPILASGPTGSARKLDGTKPTAADVKKSKQAVEEINSRKGQAYIDTQRDLPDSIVIP